MDGLPANITSKWTPIDYKLYIWSKTFEMTEDLVAELVVELKADPLLSNPDVFFDKKTKNALYDVLIQGLPPADINVYMNIPYSPFRGIDSSKLSIEDNALRDEFNYQKQLVIAKLFRRYKRLAIGLFGKDETVARTSRAKPVVATEVTAVATAIKIAPTACVQAVDEYEAIYANNDADYEEEPAPAPLSDRAIRLMRRNGEPIPENTTSSRATEENDLSSVVSNLTEEVYNSVVNVMDNAVVNVMDNEEVNVMVNAEVNAEVDQLADQLSNTSIATPERPGQSLYGSRNTRVAEAKGSPELDFYETPIPIVVRFLNRIKDDFNLNKNVVFYDPCAGKSAFKLGICEAIHHDCIVIQHDIFVRNEDVVMADFMSEDVKVEFDFLICNPPFANKVKWVEKCLALGRPFALLLPFNLLHLKSFMTVCQNLGFHYYMDKITPFFMKNGERVYPEAVGWLVYDGTHSINQITVEYF